MVTRIEALRRKIEELSAGGAVLHSPASLLYVTGFTGGEGTAVITRDGLFLLVDSRYTLQAKEEAADFDILPHDSALSNLLGSVKTVAFEKDYLSVQAFSHLQDTLPGREWADISEPLLMLRKSKDLGELASIQKAVALADAAFSHAVTRIGPGMREFEVAAIIEGYMRREAGALPSFTTICASGKRGALPHGAASDKKLEKGDFLTMDFGCQLDGYCSDITRTVCIGQANARQKEIYNIVLYAQTLAENAAKGGMEAAALDNVARKSIEGFGYGENFGHALGHGVGLAIHEYPTLSPRSHHIIEKGDVCTIEPGIYIPDFGGVRIEDMLYITENGHTVLTKSPKNLLEIL